MKSPLLVSVVLTAASASVFANELTIPKFTEETEASGVNSTYAGEYEYMVGGGVAAFDCNADGNVDLYLSGGSAPSNLYRNASQPGGALTFEYVAMPEMNMVLGAYPINIDGDAHTDLVILRRAENVVLRGLGDCRFARANEAWGFDGGDEWSVAFAATWERGASWPTIAIGNYIDKDEEDSPWGSCTDNWLHRPASDGRSFDKPIALKPSHCPLSIMFTDWNRSGTPSLRMSNDRQYYEGGQEQMWRVEPGQVPSLYTEKEGWKYLRIWGMGIASYDVNEDGYPDYALTSMADNKLQTLADAPKDGKPKPAFADIAFAKGVTAHRPYMGDDLRPSTGWHAQFDDMNNDGYVDLFYAKGNVSEMPDFANMDPNNLLLQGADGKFVETGGSSGVGSTESARGAAIADFNLDGALDLVVVNRNANAQIWRNAALADSNWVQLKLKQDGANRDAIGAMIEVRLGKRTLRREVVSGGGHASGQLGWVHFGTGKSTSAEVRITWPDGTADAWQKLGTGFHIMERGRSAKAWVPGQPI